MKKNRLITTALSSLTAAVMLAASSGAYLTIVDSPTDYLDTDEESWAILIPRDENSVAESIRKMEYVVAFEGDRAEYDKERSNGFYDNEAAKPFADFEGYIGIGAVLSIDGKQDNWYSFGYKTLTSKGNTTTADIKKLDANTYLFSCELTNVEILPTDREIQLRFMDWGNHSDYYRLTVQEFYAYDASGSVIIYSDAAGNVDYEPRDPFDRLAYSSAPAGEVTTEETTTAAPETTTAELTTEAVAAETTTTAAVTTAGTTAPAKTTAAFTTTVKSGTVQAANTDNESGNFTLVIIGIVAGVLIIGLVVGIIVFTNSKKKRNHWKEGL